MGLERNDMSLSDILNAPVKSRDASEAGLNARGRRKAYPLASWGALALCVTYALPGFAGVRLQSISLSSGVFLDRWAGTGNGNGFGWMERDDPVNRPQDNFSGSLGLGFSLAKNTSLQASMSAFHSRLEDLQYPGTSFTSPGKSKTGLGDFGLELKQKVGKTYLGARLAIPGPYTPKYEDPWAGMGVWRVGLSAGMGWDRYFAWVSPEVVVAKPDDGISEVGDYILKAGASAKFVASPWVTLKPGIELSYNSIRWVSSVDAVNLFSIDPNLTVSLAKNWKRAVSLTLGASLYSLQTGEEFLNVYAPRKVFIGLGASLYL
jgi:hypothetical protein